MFEKLNLKFKKSKFDKDNDISKTRNSEFNTPVVNAKFGDNGIMYYGRSTDFETEKMTIDIVNDGAISTGSVYPQPQETGVLYNAYLIKAKFPITIQGLHFFSSSIQKSIKDKFGYENKAGWEKVKKEFIQLPTKDGKIDFEFMDACIRELEEERIRELSAYLTVSGLDNYELSSEEKEALDKFDSPLGEKLQNVQWGECIIGDLFEKLTLKFKKSTFNKATDISKTRTSEFNIPLINAKFGDNGIMYYGRKNDFETASMTIDIVNDGAISTASVYPQPQETGVLYNAYLIKPLFDVNNQILYFLSTTIQKSIKEKFGYENKAGWEKVKKESIQLPTKDGKIDFEFMELLISAVQKLVIKDVVLYADEKIQSTKKIVKES